MTPRKKVADMTPEEREANRAYMREAKARSRKGKPLEPDNRTNEDRREYFREYRRKKRLEEKLRKG